MNPVGTSQGNGATFYVRSTFETTQTIQVHLYLNGVFSSWADREISPGDSTFRQMFAMEHQGVAVGRLEGVLDALNSVVESNELDNKFNWPSDLPTHTPVPTATPTETLTSMPTNTPTSTPAAPQNRFVVSGLEVQIQELAPNTEAHLYSFFEGTALDFKWTDVPANLLANASSDKGDLVFINKATEMVVRYSWHVVHGKILNREIYLPMVVDQQSAPGLYATETPLPQPK